MKMSLSSACLVPTYCKLIRKDAYWIFQNVACEGLWPALVGIVRQLYLFAVQFDKNGPMEINNTGGLKETTQQS